MKAQNQLARPFALRPEPARTDLSNKAAPFFTKGEMLSGIESLD